MCLVVIIADYADQPWPRTASVVDLVRASITFDSCAAMIAGMTKFQELIGNGEGGSVQKVLRVKNMFKIYNSKKNGGIQITSLQLNKFSYCDIKMNLLIHEKHTNTAIIGEIQFLS